MLTFKWGSWSGALAQWVKMQLGFLHHFLKTGGQESGNKGRSDESSAVGNAKDTFISSSAVKRRFFPIRRLAEQTQLQNIEAGTMSCDITDADREEARAFSRSGALYGGAF